MRDATIIYPSYFRIFECRTGRWFIKNPELFVSSAKKKNSLPQEICAIYGITEQQVVIELFRINGGNNGFYLANLRDKKYYYCGLQREDMKKKLLELGIGRKSPIDD